MIYTGKLTTITEGPRTFRVTEKGKIAVATKRLSGARNPAKPHVLPKAPRPRVDRDVQAWVTRVSAAISQSIDDDTREVCDRAVGKPAGAGYYVVATDGHRALLKKGKGSKKETVDVAVRTKAVSGFNLADDLSAPLVRMRAVNTGKQLQAVTLELDPAGRRLIVSTQDQTDYSQAREWVPVTGKNLEPRKLVLDPKYLLDAVGLAGQTIYLGQAETEPAMIDTADRQWRVVIMPMKPGKACVEATFEESAETRDWVAPVTVAPTAPPRKVKATTRVKAATTTKNAKPAKAERTISTRHGVDWRAAGLKAAETRRRNLALRNGVAA